MFEIAVRECFRNHVYQFDGRYYVQKEGGAIGLCLTGVVAEINMAAWEGKFRDLVKKNEIDLIVSYIYVDDQNVLFKIIKRGTRRVGTCLSWRQELLEEDDVRNEPQDKRCMREIRKMANSIRKDIQMEEDVASNHPDNKLHMLDIKVWTEEYENELGLKRVRMTTEFYEKVMVGNKMLMEKSALARKVKIT